MSQYGPFQSSSFQYLQKSINPSATYSFVLFHGFGADMGDLFPLSDYLNSGNIKDYYFPNGVIPATDMPMGRAWFPIDVRALEEAMMKGSYRDFNKELPKEVNSLCEAVENSLVKDLKLQPENTIIGGFSQGSMLAMNLFLNSNNDYKAMVQLSGSFLDRKKWTEKLKQKKSTPIYISHGETDALLNPQDAKDLADVVKNAGHNLKTNYFQGGHEIPMPVLNDLKAFLADL